MQSLEGRFEPRPQQQAPAPQQQTQQQQAPQQQQGSGFNGTGGPGPQGGLMQGQQQMQTPQWGQQGQQQQPQHGQGMMGGAMQGGGGLQMGMGGGMGGGGMGMGAGGMGGMGTNGMGDNGGVGVGPALGVSPMQQRQLQQPTVPTSSPMMGLAAAPGLNAGPGGLSALAGLSRPRTTDGLGPSVSQRGSVAHTSRSAATSVLSIRDLREPSNRGSREDVLRTVFDKVDTARVYVCMRVAVVMCGCGTVPRVCACACACVYVPVVRKGAVWD